MKKLRRLIDELEAEASGLGKKDRSLTNVELSRLEAVHQALGMLRQTEKLVANKDKSSNLITYKIVSDLDGLLKTSGRTACNFWNRFVAPSSSIVIRLGVFFSASRTIARAYKPYVKNDIKYGVVEFNTKYLERFEAEEIAGTIVHEIGHTLGFGWDIWETLFSKSNGVFHSSSVNRLNSLDDMRVELDGGPGTQYSHWDEDQFDKELMTGYQNSGEHVLPVTIDIMSILGHDINERLDKKTNLSELLQSASLVQFTRQKEAKALDLDYFEETTIFEEIPHAK